MKTTILLFVLLSSIAFSQVGTIASETKSVKSRVVATAAGGFWARFVLPTGTKDLYFKNLTSDTAKIAFKAADTVTEMSFQSLIVMSGANNVFPFMVERFKYDTVWYKGTASTSILIVSLSR